MSSAAVAAAAGQNMDMEEFVADDLLSQFIDDNDFFFPEEDDLDFIPTTKMNDPTDINDAASRLKPSKRKSVPDSQLKVEPSSVWAGRVTVPTSKLAREQKKLAETTGAVVTPNTPLDPVLGSFLGASDGLETLAKGGSAATDGAAGTGSSSVFADELSSSDPFCVKTETSSMAPPPSMGGLSDLGDASGSLLGTAGPATAGESDTSLSEDMSKKPGKRGRKRKSDSLTEDERAEMTRQRNREHARSTRKRKKEYMEQLKEQVDRLSEKQQQLIASGTDLQAIKERVERECARKEAIQMFFEYRSSGIVDKRKWSSLLEDGFEMTLPITPYRGYPTTDIKGNLRVVRDVDGVVEDTKSLADLVASIGSKNPAANQPKPDLRKKVRLEYTVATEDILVVNDRVMCQWKVKTENAVANGAFCELQLDGMLKCTFSETNKLSHMDLTFDVMGFMQQLDIANQSGGQGVIPSQADARIGGGIDRTLSSSSLSTDASSSSDNSPPSSGDTSPTNTAPASPITMPPPPTNTPAVTPHGIIQQQPMLSWAAASTNQPQQPQLLQMAGVPGAQPQFVQMVGQPNGHGQMQVVMIMPQQVNGQPQFLQMPGSAGAAQPQFVMAPQLMMPPPSGK